MTGSDVAVAYQVAAEAMREGLRPPPKLTVSEWADAFRILPETAAKPGPWRTNETPYLREIMDTAGDPLVRQVVFMKPSQVGGSETLNNILGFLMDQDPTSVLLVQPTTRTAEEYSKERVAAMIADTPRLREKVGSAGDDTITAKSFPGGHLGIVGANAPTGLRSRARRVVLFDEVDAYPASAGTEGDPRDLARKRQTTYGFRAFEAEFSTPTLKDFSPIEEDLEQCDEVRRYHVPCPHCEQLQVLSWDRVEWPKRDAVPGESVRAGEVRLGGAVHQVAKAAYRCVHCSELIEDRWRRWMIRDDVAGGTATWIADEPHPEPARIGFHLNALYSPWFPWSEMAEEFVKAQGNKLRLQVWVNTRLAETWDEKGRALAAEPLLDRRETYGVDPLPERVLVLTAGVDVQVDRLEMEIVGWGLDTESWSMEYLRIPGDPTGNRVWQDLDRVLLRTFQHPLGPRLRIAATVVDAGYLATTVKNYSRDRVEMRVWAGKGMDGWGRPIIDRPLLNTKGKVPLYPLGVDNAKRVVYAHLGILPPDGWNGKDPVPGYCHFPDREPYDLEYFNQLTAEKMVHRQNNAGRLEPKWVRKPNRRAEALDVRNYALAAFEGLVAAGLRLEEVHAEFTGARPAPVRGRRTRSSGVA